MPQNSYVRPLAQNGQIAEGGPRRIDSYVNPLLAQQTEVQWAGTGAAGDYTVRIQGTDGTDVTLSYTSPGGEADVDIMNGITAAAAAEEDLLNVVVVGDDATDTNEFDFIHPGEVYTFFVTAAAGTGTVSEIQAAGGTDVPIGVVVAQGPTDDSAVVVGAATVDADIVGITIRNTESEVNTGVNTAVDSYKPADEISAMVQGTVWVEVEDAVAKNGNVFFRIQNAAAGTDEGIGKLRSDADGGDAVQLLGAKFGSTTSGPGLATVVLNRPA